MLSNVFDGKHIKIEILYKVRIKTTGNGQEQNFSFVFLIVESSDSFFCWQSVSNLSDRNFTLPEHPYDYYISI